jgi:hypothetical protein
MFTIIVITYFSLILIFIIPALIIRRNNKRWDNAKFGEDGYEDWAEEDICPECWHRVKITKNELFPNAAQVKCECGFILGTYEYDYPESVIVMRDALHDLRKSIKTGQGYRQFYNKRS